MVKHAHLQTQLDTWYHVCAVGPLPMEDIAKMADECMRDVDEDEDDSNVEDDEDLLVSVHFIYFHVMPSFVPISI